MCFDIEFAVEIRAGSSFGVVRGAVPKGRFLVGRPWEMVVAGVVRMYLRGSGRSIRQAYMGEYRLEPLMYAQFYK